MSIWTKAARKAAVAAVFGEVKRHMPQSILERAHFAWGAASLIRHDGPCQGARFVVLIEPEGRDSTEFETNADIVGSAISARSGGLPAAMVASVKCVEMLATLDRGACSVAHAQKEKREIAVAAKAAKKPSRPPSHKTSTKRLFSASRR